MDESEATTGSRRDQRRREIVDIAASLFARKGYHATGTSDLCEAASLGKGALYYYIDSKENLLALIHDRVMEELLGPAEEIVSADTTALERLRALGFDLVEAITRYPDHVWVFLHEWRALTGDRADRFRVQRQRYEELVREVLRSGVTSGEFVVHDLDLVTYAWLNLHNYTYIWYRPGRGYDSDEIAATYFEVFTTGIVKPGAGRRRLEGRHALK